MRREPLRYVAQRLVFLVAVVWFSATVNFLLPRITAHDPVLEHLLEQAARTGRSGEQGQSMLAFYERWAGRNQPLWRQYLMYLRNMVSSHPGSHLPLAGSTHRLRLDGSL